MFNIYFIPLIFFAMCSRNWIFQLVWWMRWVKVDVRSNSYLIFRTVCQRPQPELVFSMRFHKFFFNILPNKHSLYRICWFFIISLHLGRRFAFGKTKRTISSWWVLTWTNFFHTVFLIHKQDLCEHFTEILLSNKRLVYHWKIQ